MELPEFGILFSDGTFWDFLVEKYFIKIEYGQILYDMKKSRLGNGPMKCVKV
jgi:hypothetical protein